MGRKSFAFCLCLCLLLNCVGYVSAEGFDGERLGSISVTLTDGARQTPIGGAELSLYYIATVSLNATGNLGYTYVEDFADCGIALEDPALASKLDAYLAQTDLPGVKLYTDGEGTLICRDLPLGLYFLRQTGVVEGYAPCTPFLVTVPMERAGEYVYDVDASPKTEVAKLTDITVRKVWNTDEATEATESVTVQLLCKDTVVETAVLNEENNWQVTYTDLPESDAYSIREVNIPRGFTATYERRGYVFIVTNTANLVDTGQLQWPIPVLAVSGMLLIWLGLELLQKKRDNTCVEE